MLMTVLVAGAVPSVDRFFLEQVTQDNLAELALVRYVERTSGNRTIQDACRVMIQDHSQLLGEVQALARSFRVDLPNSPDPMQQALIQHLEGKRGRDLDRDFTAVQLRDHIEDVNNAMVAAELTRTPTIRDFAREAIKTYAKHEVIWRKIAPLVGVPSAFGRPTAEQILEGKSQGG